MNPESPYIFPQWLMWALVLTLAIGVGFMTWFDSSEAIAEISAPPLIVKVKSKKLPAPTTAISETEWQTYTNTKFDYSIDYPPGWYVYGDNTSNNASLATTASFAQSGAKDRSYYIMANSAGLNIVINKDTSAQIQKVLASFRLTGIKAPNTSTSNWQTYTNTKYGYSIQYQPDWYVYGDSGSQIDVNTSEVANFAKNSAQDRSYMIQASDSEVRLIFSEDSDPNISQVINSFQLTQ